jgi:Lipocalin-like domain
MVLAHSGKQPVTLNGHVDLVLLASPAREENKETADGTITYFGTYSASEADSSIAIHVEGSSFPNWSGTEQKRFVAIAGDLLTLTVRPPAGDVVDVIWKRAK